MPPIKLGNSINLQQAEIQNAVVHKLASQPGSIVAGQLWYDSTNNRLNYYNGTASISLVSSYISSITGSGAISANTVSGATTVSIAAASGTVPGTMSSADFTKLFNATNLNTISTLVLRDGSGNFSAGTITANLTGTASTASALVANSLTNSMISNSAAIDVSKINFNSNINFGSFTLISSATPTNGNDLVNKSYADSLSSGLDTKASVKYNSVSNIVSILTANAATVQAALDPISTVAPTLATNDRILVKAQTSASENGIYIWTGTALVRSSDANTNALVTSGLFVFIEQGDNYQDTGWVLSTDGTITLGSTALTFTQFSNAGTITNGNGLAKVGNTLSVVGTTNRISVSGSGVDISSSYVGQSSITTLGTIATGTWNASTIAVLYGGTGATSASGARTNLGAAASGANSNITSLTGLTTPLSVDQGGTGVTSLSALKTALAVPSKYITTIGDGTTTIFTFTHGLGTKDFTWSVRDTGTDSYIITDIRGTTTNTATVSFYSAPTAGQYSVTLIG
jgi:hypothetical protein